MTGLNPAQFGPDQSSGGTIDSIERALGGPARAGGIDWDAVANGLQQEAHNMHMRAGPMTESTESWGGVRQGMTLSVPPSGFSGPLKSTSLGGQATWRDPTPNWTSDRMFMSANEIMASHQPLEGDRENRMTEAGHRRYPPPAPSSAWGDFAGSSGAPDLPLDPAPGQRGRTAGGGQLVPIRAERRETDAELWERKLDEAEHYSENDRYERPKPGVESSLAEAVRAEGVKKPISLSTHQFGPQMSAAPAKPQIVGGHHRLAVMADHDPDALMPVLHFRNISEAQHGGTPYKYS